MNDKNICFYNAKVFTGNSFEEGGVFVKESKIESIFFQKTFSKNNFCKNTRFIDLKGAWLCPGFIDTHIHGLEGYGVGNSVEDILEISKRLAKYGVTSFIPTISRGIAEKNNLIESIETVVQAMGKEEGAKILGIHLEGPFLSLKRVGGQVAEGIIPIDINFMQKLWDSSKGSIINMTIAPELDGVKELVGFCAEKGIILQAGHTDATYEQMIEAKKFGITHVTHMFNAMRGLHHREPGAVGAILDFDEFSCELIGDGIHVNPAVIRILAKQKPTDKIVLITDALKNAKRDIKSYFVDEEEICLDKCFYRKSDGTIVGSNISMIDGVQNLVSFGIPLIAVVRMAASNPAKIMKIKNKGIIEIGMDADLTVFDADFNIIHTMVEGVLKI